MVTVSWDADNIGVYFFQLSSTLFKISLSFLYPILRYIAQIWKIAENRHNLRKIMKKFYALSTKSLSFLEFSLTFHPPLPVKIWKYTPMTDNSCSQYSCEIYWKLQIYIMHPVMWLALNSLRLQIYTNSLLHIFLKIPSAHRHDSPSQFLFPHPYCVLTTSLHVTFAF